jgi:hypothetical protein
MNAPVEDWSTESLFAERRAYKVRELGPVVTLGDDVVEQDAGRRGRCLLL